MYKIGEFSILTGLSVKTLRYYDEIGLLKPSKIDSYTNYRYYLEEELKHYKRIEYLKRLGFTLEEIRKNIDNMTIEFLDFKRYELIFKRDFINSQIDELEEFRSSLKRTVKTLKQ